MFKIYISESADKGTARQPLIPMALFTESRLNGISTPPLEAINQTSTTLRDFSKSLSNLLTTAPIFIMRNGNVMEKCSSISNYWCPIN